MHMFHMLRQSCRADVSLRPLGPFPASQGKTPEELAAKKKEREAELSQRSEMNMEHHNKFFPCFELTFCILLS